MAAMTSSGNDLFNQWLALAKPLVFIKWSSHEITGTVLEKYIYQQKILRWPPGCKQVVIQR